MWYEHIGFKVDRAFISAMQVDDLEAVKRLLIPSKDPEEVSLNSLLPEVIKLGTIYMCYDDTLLDFCRLSDRKKKEDKVAFDKYLTESVAIIVDLIDYLVRKGANVNAVMDYAEHGIWCSDGDIFEARSGFACGNEIYNISTSLYMPLAIGKFNSGFVDKPSPVRRFKHRGDRESNHIRALKKDLIIDLRERNLNIQIKLTQKLIDHGANLDATCISEKGHETNFLDFINDCADSKFSNQKKLFLTFYELQKSKNPKQILESLKKPLDASDPNLYERSHSFKPCSALEDLIQKKLCIEVGKEFAFWITGSSDNPIGYVVDFLNLEDLTAVVDAIEEKQGDLSLKSIGEALENVSSSISNDT